MEEPVELATGRLLQHRSPLLPADAPVQGGVTHQEVDTPEALLAALQAGVDHVVVVNHLDLTSLLPAAASTTPGTSEPLLLARDTKSIRVRDWNLPHHHQQLHSIAV
jgi:hypothetical protein